MTTQKTYTFGNLQITKTRIEGTRISKFIEVSRFNGQFWELISQSDPDYSKAVIMSLNEENN